MGYDYQVIGNGDVIKGAKLTTPLWAKNLFGDDFFADVVVVNLFRTKVTDAGLEHLQGLTELDLLDVVNTKVTPEGVGELQQALPNCGIRH